MTIIDAVKLEKYRKAVALYKQDKTYNEIAKEVHVSFGTIKKAVDLDMQGMLYPGGGKDTGAAAATTTTTITTAGTSSRSSSLSAISPPHSSSSTPPPPPPPLPSSLSSFSKEDIEIDRLRRLSDKEKVSEAYRLFSSQEGGKKEAPVQVAIMLELRLDFVNQLYREYLASVGLHGAGELARRLGEKGVRKLAAVYDAIQARKLTVGEAQNCIEYAQRMSRLGYDLEQLEQKVARRQRELDTISSKVKDEGKAAMEVCEKSRAEWAALKERIETLKQQHPEATAAEIAEKRGAAVLSSQPLLLRSALDAVILAMRSDPTYRYLVFPGEIPDFVYSLPDGPRQIQEAIKEQAVQLGGIYFNQLLNHVLNRQNRSLFLEKQR